MESAKSASSKRQKKRLIKGIGLILVIAGVLVLMEHVGEKQASRFMAVVRDTGPLGPVVFIVCNALSAVLMLPQSVLTVVGGVLFGWMWGTVYSLVGMTLGATICFLMARYGLRERLLEKFGDNDMFTRLQEASGRKAIPLMATARMVPVFHFSLASYLLGITKVRFIPYVILTAIFMTPETLLLASGGHLALSGLVHGHVPPAAIIALAIAAVVGIGVTFWFRKRGMQSQEK